MCQILHAWLQLFVGTVTKPKNKEGREKGREIEENCTTAILQTDYLNRVASFHNAYYHTSFQELKISGASVAVLS